MVFINEDFKKKSGDIRKKIFTCEEIEGRGLPNSRAGSLEKHVDPAIVFLSSQSKMTRYDKADLLLIKDGRLSQQPPPCYYEPAIMRLNILKYRNSHTEEIEDQMKVFREKLQNLTLASWDPNLLHLLKNYHNALLNPYYNSGYAGNFQNQQPLLNFANQQPPQIQPPNRVSFMEKQQSVLDKIPSYDRNMNFFDNITTTATMRPPPRMGVNSYNNNSYYKRPNQYNNNNITIRKPNSCASEHVNSYNSSVGYFSANDTKSSYEESLLEKQCEKRAPFDFNKKMDSNVVKKFNGENEEEEKEPEWFSVPATLNDFIDLHGFEDEPDDPNKNSKEVNGNCDFKQPFEHQNNPINNNSSSSFQNDFHQQNRRYNNPNNSFTRYPNNHNANNRNMNYRQNQSPIYNQINNAVNNQRFRNPLHFAKQTRTQTPQLINPFFDAWRNGKCLNKQNISFNDLMEHHSYPRNVPNNAVHMSEIENRMKQHQNFNGTAQIAPPAAVPQFFQNLANNWGVHVNEHQNNNIYQQYSTGPPKREPYQMPTHEQLQQFTSEIMRNAILRKNQQYHNENNFQK